MGATAPLTLGAIGSTVPMGNAVGRGTAGDVGHDGAVILAPQ